MFVSLLFRAGSRVFSFVLKGPVFDSYVDHLTSNNSLFADRAVMVLRARDPRLLSSIRSSKEEWPVLSLLKRRS